MGYKVPSTVTTFKIEGESQSINSQTVYVDEYDADGYVLRCHGTATITDGAANYAKGCLYRDTDVVTGTSGLYENVGTTSSCNFDLVAGSGGGGGGGSTLDDVYENGPSVTMDRGAIALNDATASTANTLEIVQTGAKSGNLIDISVDAAMTGYAIALDMNLGIAAPAVYIDNGATARTGSDIQVKSDSTGAHSVINIDAEGSGASIGFDWTGSYNGSPAGQAIKLTFDANDNLDTEAMQIDTGAGARGIMFDMNFGHTDSGTTSHIFDIDVDGTLDSNVLDITYGTAASTGHAINVSTGTNLAGNAMRVTTAGVRTAPVINVVGAATDAGTDDHIFFITQSGLLDSNLIQLTYDTAASTGNAIDIVTGTNLAGNALKVTTAGIRTAPVINVVGAGTDGGTDDHIILITQSAVLDSNMVQLTYDTAASTGDALGITMGTNLAGSALAISSTGARTDDLIKIDDDSTGNSHIFDINLSGIYTGNVIDIAYSVAAVAGDMLNLALGTGVAASAIVISGTGARTDDIIKIDTDDTGTAHDFDINISGIGSGNCIDINYSAADTGTAINIATGSNLAGNALAITTAGTRTAPVINIVGGGADGGTDDHIFFVTQSGILDSNIIQLTYDTAASTGDAIGVTMGTNLAGSALVISRTGVVTDDTIKIDSDQTGSTHQFDINLSGAGSGNCFDLAYSVAANTGNAINIAMGTNVGGQAMVVTSSATGAANEGSGYDLTHDGNLVANADLFRIVSTGSHDATSNVVYLEQSTGAGSAGTTLLRLNASGANVEAMAVDAGVVFLSVATATPGSGDGETLPCSANTVHYDPNGASRTGVIVTAGLRDGQKLTIVNIADAAENITFAAAGVSNVAGGASVSIARFECLTLVWCAATSLWYCMGAGL